MSSRSSEQLTKLLDLLSEDGLILNNGRISYKKETKFDFWKRIANELNSLPGAIKDAEKWCKVWVDIKDLAKRKARALNELTAGNADHGNAVKPLTDQEKRILELINYYNQRGNQYSKQIVLDNGMDVLLDYIDQGDTNQQSDGEGSDNSENVVCKTEMVEDSKTNLKIENVPMDTENSSDSSDDFPIVEEKRPKVRGRPPKKKRLKRNTSKVIDEFREKAKFALEKEKVRQKREELRLKALELKLKGDELKLMELEMKKLNHLTGIEEEKLSCFKDMSAMLKELVDKSRAGNLRFSSVD